MPDLIEAGLCDTRARPGPLQAGFAAVACLVRGLPLFVSAAPRTPLRVLCIVALDTIHVLRHSRPLLRQRRRDLAAFLDFQACTNAVWDQKPVCAPEYETLRERLENAGLGSWMTEYLWRVRELETRRPPAGGDLRCFHDVRLYREAVARLSLAVVAAIALNGESLDEAIEATHGDADVSTLFRMAMQCQIIDDVIDYREDLSAGLPSFLTASASPRRSLALVADAARSYGAGNGRSAEAAVFPLHVALHVLTLVTKLVVGLARREKQARISGEAL